MMKKAIYGLLALLLSAFYLTGSLELDGEEFKAHYQQEQISCLCTASPLHVIPAATVVTLLPEPSFFRWPLLHRAVSVCFSPAWLLREPVPPGRRFLRLRVLRL